MNRSHRPSSFLSPPTIALVVGATLALALAAACVDDATSGRRVTLETAVEASAARGRAFTTSRGWIVTLERAAASFGSLYYYEGAALLADGRPAPTRTRWLERGSWLVTVPLARAHPGHYTAGDVRGQSLGGATVDLLAGPAPLPRGEGVTGRYRSASVSLSPRAGDALAGHVAELAGAASKGSLVRHFRVVVDGADFGAADGVLRVDGCAFDEVEVVGDGTVTVAVAVEAWIDPVDFTELPEASAEAPAEIARGTVAYRELVRAMKSAAAYRLRFTPSP